MSNPSTSNTSTEERALALLGDGIEQSVVASHLGVTESRISQIISQPEFAERLIALRYENLSKHNARDKEYDAIEDALVVKMKESLPLLFRPEQILNALTKINAAKRRGSSAPVSIGQQQTIVKITMPVRVINRFTTNVLNQVVEAGDQKLVTVQSGVLMKHLKEREEKREAVLIEQDPSHGHERNEGSGDSTSRPNGTNRTEQTQGSGNPASYPVPA